MAEPRIVQITLSLRHVRAADAADRRIFRAWSFSQSTIGGVVDEGLQIAGFCYC